MDTAIAETRAQEERRRCPRQAKKLPMKLLNQEQAVVESFPVMHDLSSKGFRFTASKMLTTGEIFWFSILLPRKRAISGMARTRWARPGEEGRESMYGAEIEQMDWVHAWKLKQSLSTLNTELLALDSYDLATILTCFWLAYRTLQGSDSIFTLPVAFFIEFVFIAVCLIFGRYD